MQSCSWASQVAGGFMVGSVVEQLQVVCPSHLVLSASLRIGDTWLFRDGFVLQQKSQSHSKL